MQYLPISPSNQVLELRYLTDRTLSCPSVSVVTFVEPDEIYIEGCEIFKSQIKNLEISTGNIDACDLRHAEKRCSERSGIIVIDIHVVILESVFIGNQSK